MDPRQATDALLALIEEDRVRQCEAIEAEAQRLSSAQAACLHAD